VSLISLLLALAVAATPLAEQTWARVAVAGWVLLALSFSVSLLLARMRRSESRIDRARLAYLATGAGLSILFAGLDFLPRFDLPFPTVGPIISTLYLFFLSQTLLRLRLMDLHELFGKMAAQAVLAMILAVVFVVLTAWVGDKPRAVSVQHHRRGIRDAHSARAAARQGRRAGGGHLLPRAVRFSRLDAGAAGPHPQHHRRRPAGEPAARRSERDAPSDPRLGVPAGRRPPGFRLVDSRGPQPVPFIDAGTARALVSRTEKAQLLETVERRIVEIRAQPSEVRRSRDELKRLNDVKGAMQQMRAGICVPLVGNDR